MSASASTSARAFGRGLQRLCQQREERAPAALEIADLTLEFGGIRALDGVSLEVRPGSIHAVIGPNGAGKSSLLNCIMGLYRPQRGQIALRGPTGERVQLIDLAPPQIARLGVARTFQNLELFRRLTVLENLMLGRHIHMDLAILPSLLWLRAGRQEITERPLVEEVIELLGLEAVRHQQVSTLSYGHAKRVELGRALCLQPSVLLLDEPMAGMNREEKEDMARCILDINELLGVTVVLIEHDLQVVMDLCQRVSVLSFGRLLADGAPSEVGRDARVLDAYLGKAFS